jgi:hypothetical protein
MSFGKSGGSSTTIPTLSPEQNAMIKAQTGFFTGTVQPSYEQAVKGATDMYNASQGGVANAAQNLAGTAAQAQKTFGETGESALRTGISGLQNLFTPEYEQRQLQAALAPAQMQYQQNLTGQGMQFGGSGQLGSARQALAGQQLAGQTQAAQMSAAANVENQIAQQRMAAGQSLIGAGQGGLTNALGAAGQGVTAAMTPQQLYNQYASILYGTPSQSYSPNFAGTQGSQTSGSGYNFGANYKGPLPF